MEQTLTAQYRATNVIPTIREQGRSVAWLARQIGLSRQYVSDIAHGHMAVREDVARRVGAALGVPFFVLFDVSDGGDIPLSGRTEVAA